MTTYRLPSLAEHKAKADRLAAARIEAAATWPTAPVRSSGRLRPPVPTIEAADPFGQPDAAASRVRPDLAAQADAANSHGASGRIEADPLASTTWPTDLAALARSRTAAAADPAASLVRLAVALANKATAKRIEADTAKRKGTDPATIEAKRSAIEAVRLATIEAAAARHGAAALPNLAALASVGTLAASGAKVPATARKAIEAKAATVRPQQAATVRQAVRHLSPLAVAALVHLAQQADPADPAEAAETVTFDRADGRQPLGARTVTATVPVALSGPGTGALAARSAARIEATAAARVAAWRKARTYWRKAAAAHRRGDHAAVVKFGEAAKAIEADHLADAPDPLGLTVAVDQVTRLSVHLASGRPVAPRASKVLVSLADPADHLAAIEADHLARLATIEAKAATAARLADLPALADLAAKCEAVRIEAASLRLADLPTARRASLASLAAARSAMPATNRTVAHREAKAAKAASLADPVAVTVADRWRIEADRLATASTADLAATWRQAVRIEADRLADLAAAIEAVRTVPNGRRYLRALDLAERAELAEHKADRLAADPAAIEADRLAARIEADHLADHLATIEADPASRHLSAAIEAVRTATADLATARRTTAKARTDHLAARSAHLASGHGLRLAIAGRPVRIENASGGRPARTVTVTVRGIEHRAEAGTGGRLADTRRQADRPAKAKAATAKTEAKRGARRVRLTVADLARLAIERTA